MAGKSDGEIIITTKLKDDLSVGLSKLGSTVKTAFHATAVAVAGVTTAVGAGVAAVSRLATNYASFTDRIDKQSQRLGMSKEQFQEWDYILGQCGGSVDSLEAGMKTMVSVLDGVKTGNQQNIDTLLRLQDESGKTIDLNASQSEQYEQMVDALMAVSDEQTRAALAVDIFGRAGTDMIPMLNTGKEGVEQLRQSAHDLGIVLSDDAVNSGVAFGDAMDDAKKAATGFMNESLGPIIPNLTELAKAFTGVMTGAEGADAQLSTALDVTLKGITDTVATLLPGVIDVGTKILLSLASGIIDAIPQMTEQLPQLIETLVTGITELLPKLVEAAVAIVTALATGIWDNRQLILDSVEKLVLELLDVIKDNGIQLWNMTKEAITSVASCIWDNREAIIQKAKDIWNYVWNWLEGLPRELFDVGRNIVSGLVEGITDKMSAPVDAIKDVGSKMLTGIKDFFGIHSPSRAMMSIGQYLDKGLAAGITLEDGTVVDAATAQAQGLTQVWVDMAENGTILGAAVSKATLDGYDPSEVADKTKDAGNKVEKTWKDVGASVRDSLGSAFKSCLSGFGDLGESIATGTADWASFGKAALTALASILESLGAELAAMAVAKVLSHQWGQAALATAGSVAAYVAAGLIKGWANSFATGGIVEQQSGTPATGDQTVVWANPGEVILNASQQDGLVSTMKALGTYGDYRRERQEGITVTQLYNVLNDVLDSKGLSVTVNPSDINIDGVRVAKILWSPLDSEASRLGFAGVGRKA